MPDISIISYGRDFQPIQASSSGQDSAVKSELLCETILVPGTGKLLSEVLVRALQQPTTLVQRSKHYGLAKVRCQLKHLRQDSVLACLWSVSGCEADILHFIAKDAMRGDCSGSAAFVQGVRTVPSVTGTNSIMPVPGLRCLF